MDSSSLYASSSNTSSLSGGAAAVVWIIYVALLIFGIVTTWRIFTKAGKHGWASIIPIYNSYTLLKIAGRPWWWLLLFCIPIVNIVFLVLLSIDLAKSFGKSTLFGVVGLFIFSIVGYAMLAFGSATYQGPSASDGTTPPTPDGVPPMQPPAAVPPPTPTV